MGCGIGNLDPQSRHLLESAIKCLESGIHSVEFRIQDCLQLRLTWGERSLSVTNHSLSKGPALERLP